MWLTNGQNEIDAIPTGIDTVHNYYERLVLDEIARSSDRAREDKDFFADVACVALNRLPPRYIRYDVDTTFFLSPIELQEIDSKVEAAVSAALEYVSSRERPSDDIPLPNQNTKVQQAANRS